MIFKNMFFFFYMFLNLADRNSVGSFLCVFCKLHNPFQYKNLNTSLLLKSKMEDAQYSSKLENLYEKFLMYRKKKVFKAIHCRIYGIVSFSSFNATWVLEVASKSHPKQNVILPKAKNASFCILIENFVSQHRCFSHNFQISAELKS